MKKLRIHYLQHVPFENLGCIESWALQKGHSLSATRFYENTALPNLENIDGLIVMGGPMSVHDEEQYPWLKWEKAFIRDAIEADKTVIGICLGAQLVATALGASVYPNLHKEIGWYDVALTDEGAANPLLADFEPTFKVFHWHGATFELPADSRHLLRSEGCENQAFLYRQNVLGLQFHFEVTLKSLEEMLKHGKSELVEDRYVQSAKAILSGKSWIEENNKKMFSILDRLLQNY